MFLLAIVSRIINKIQKKPKLYSVDRYVVIDHIELDNYITAKKQPEMNIVLHDDIITKIVVIVGLLGFAGIPAVLMTGVIAAIFKLRADGSFILLAALFVTFLILLKKKIWS